MNLKRLYIVFTNMECLMYCELFQKLDNWIKYHENQEKADMELNQLLNREHYVFLITQEKHVSFYSFHSCLCTRQSALQPSQHFVQNV